MYKVYTRELDGVSKYNIYAILNLAYPKEYTYYCYELKLKELSNRTTLVLSNTREPDRVSSTK